jgi:serine/threonine protein kinase
MDRVVAIKELPAEAVDSPAARERFHHEVKAAARLIHPHIVTAFDAGEQEASPTSSWSTSMGRTWRRC